MARSRLADGTGRCAGGKSAIEQYPLDGFDGLGDRQEYGPSAPNSSRGCRSEVEAEFNCQQASPIRQRDLCVILPVDGDPARFAEEQVV
jgi:hypothetical protein